MSTETKKLMITPGKAFLDEGVTGALVVVEDKNLADFFSLEEEHWANAELYMLAHNVYNQTGLSPRDLVEKLRGFAEAVERLKKQVELCDYRDGLDHEFRMNAAYLDLITIQFQKP